MYNWNWSVLWSPSTDGIPYLTSLLYGLAWTLVVGLSAWVLALVVGTAVGIARTFQSGAIARIAAIYVDVLRSIPLIVQMFLWFYIAPDLLPVATGNTIKASSHYNVIAAIVCLALFTSARVAEQVRAGIQSIPRGQTNAARALGLGPALTYRYVLVPMGLRMVIPVLTNEFVNVIKNTSVAFTISVVELMAATRSMQEMTFQVFEAFTVATVIYLAINLLVVRFMAFLERRFAVPGYSIRGMR